MAIPDVDAAPVFRFELPRTFLRTLRHRLTGDTRPAWVIELYDEHLVIPTGWEEHLVTVPLEHVKGIRVVSELRRALLTIETGTRTWNFPVAGRAAAAKAHELVTKARECCAALANGDLSTAHIETREATVAALSKHGARAIYAVVPLLAIAYGVRLLFADDIFDLDYFGATTPPLVMRGEVYRLITAAWLHANAWHIAGNLVAIVWLGVAVERVVGPARLIVIMTAATLGGSLGSLWLTPAHSIGASGVGMGLGASFAVIALVYGRNLPRPLARPGWWWVVFALLLLPSPDSQHGAIVDHAAHTGGVFGGGLATWFFVRSQTLERARTPNLAWLAGLCLLLHAAALATLGVRVARTEMLSEMARLTELVRSNGVSPYEANEVAWHAAIDKKAQPATINAAMRLAETALQIAPNDVQLADTVATLHHRSGGDQRAAELEAGTLDRASMIYESMTFATQLARFLAARRDTPSGITITTDEREAHVTFDSAERAKTAMTVYAVAYRNGHIEGLLRLGLPAGQQERNISLQKMQIDAGVYGSLAAPIGEDIAYGTMLVRAGCACRDGSEIAAWPIDPEVLTWP